MPRDIHKPPDWRRPSDYHPLQRLDRAAFAWELLRRNPAYRSAIDALGRGPAGDGTVLTQSPRAAVVAADWGLRFPGGAGPLCPIRTIVLAG